MSEDRRLQAFEPFDGLYGVGEFMDRRWPTLLLNRVRHCAGVEPESVVNPCRRCGKQPVAAFYVVYCCPINQPSLLRKWVPMVLHDKRRNEYAVLECECWATTRHCDNLAIARVEWNWEHARQR